MKIKALLVCAVMILGAATSARAADPKLDGAYKLTGIKFQGGGQTEAQVKGMLVVHGKYLAFVRASTNRKTWEQSEPKEEQTKKMAEAYQGLSATAGSIEVAGNIITLTQLAQANPASMGKATRYQYRLDGKNLTIMFADNPGVEFTFERLP